MIKELSHMTFIVKNIEKTKHMLEYLFSAKEVYSSEGKNFSLSDEKFFLINNMWIVIMENKQATLPKTYNHIAFKISESDYDDYLRKIKLLKLEIKNPRKRVEGEGASIYFYDYDNHLFELHTGTLEQRLNAYSLLDTQ